jgi:serine/threonine protein kinase
MLQPGSILADRYRLERELGAGGMATVYLALDQKHDRRVAVKVLRPELSAIVGAERFLNEIRTTANLQHPHILPLHDSGEINGVIFYVMPLVEGESLRDRLNREKQLPIDDAVRIAHDTAEALDYAHRHGVIHRDIKPENILLHDERALVADFGIALAVSTAGAATRMTETGMSLGTPHYMSPEQAMGEREITARSDVYALGCVLYEMLAGEPPFTGPTAQAIIAKVVTSDPPQLTTLRRTVPAHVAGAVHIALQRLPADRFATARDFADAITGKRTAPGTLRFLETPHKPVAAIELNWRALLPWGLVAAAVIAAASGWTRRLPEPPVPPLVRFTVADESSLPTGIPGRNIVLTPDGRRLLFRSVALGASGNFLVRDLANLGETVFEGIGQNPSLSSDGASVAYQQGGGVLVRRLGTGTATQLAEGGAQPSWGNRNRIVLVRDSVLHTIAATGGGASEQLTTRDRERGERRHAWPSFLPGDEAVVFSIVDTVPENDELAVVTLADRRIRRLGVRGTSAQYLDGGFLVFGRYDGTGWAVPFDLKRLEVTGPELQVLDQLIVRGGGAVELTVARNGTVAYVQGSVDDHIALVDDNGRSEFLTERAARFNKPQMSPDRSRVVATMRDAAAGKTDVYLLDVASRSLRRLTNDGQSTNAWWGANGQSVIWQTVNGNRAEIREQVLDGRSPPRTLYTASVPDTDSSMVIAVDPGGQWILGVVSAVGGQTADIHVARKDSAPLVFRPLIATQDIEQSPSVSPDGRWLAWRSNESGRYEIYVTSFPDAGVVRRVSTGGGIDPVWTADSRSLYYRANTRMVHARFNPGLTNFTTDTLFTLARFPRPNLAARVANYSVTPDGKLLMLEGDQSRRLVVVTSWVEELRQRFASVEREP